MESMDSTVTLEDQDGRTSTWSVEMCVGFGDWKPDLLNRRAIGDNSLFPAFVINTVIDAEEYLDERLVEGMREDFESRKRDYDDGYLSHEPYINESYDTVLNTLAHEFAKKNTELYDLAAASYLWICGGCFLFYERTNSGEDVHYDGVENFDAEQWYNQIFTPHLYDFAYNIVYSVSQVTQGEIR